jgi:glutamyl-tRNA synthetase
MIVGLVKERATFVSNFWELSSFFFISPVDYDEKATKKAIKEDTCDLMKELVAVLEVSDDSSKDELQNSVKGWITSKDIGFGKVMMPLRLALVGALQGPDVFDIIFMIGKIEAIKRVNNLINSFS